MRQTGIKADFNLAIIRESLAAIAASSADQLALNKNGLEYLDDIFDPMPLDFIKWLEDAEILNQAFTINLRALYQQIEDQVGFMSFQEQGEFIALDSPALKKLRSSASELLDSLNGSF